MHRVLSSFISILELRRHMPRQLPRHCLCSWQICLPLCLNSAVCINIKQLGSPSAGPPQPQGDAKLLERHLSFANGGKYNGRYGKSTQRRAPQLYRYGKKEMQLCTHIVRCQVWVQVVNAWKVIGWIIKHWSEFCVSLNKCNKFFAIKGHQKGHKQAITTHHRPWLRWSRLSPCSPVARLQPH